MSFHKVDVNRLREKERERTTCIYFFTHERQITVHESADSATINRAQLTVNRLTETN